MSESLPQRQTNRLLRGRVSAPGAIYFLTTCTVQRAPILMQRNHQDALRLALAESFRDSHQLHAACIMPDHVHVLFTLGTQLSVGQVMGKFKTSTRRHLIGAQSWTWQRNGFEHRLRDVEVEADYAFYLYMNPYRAGLIPMTAPWTGWICPAPKRYGFLSELTVSGAPPPEWLDRMDGVSARIVCPS